MQTGEWLSTLPGDDDHPYRTGPWQPLRAELDADDLAVVEGELPDDLEGVYLRNTENPLHPAIERYHPFDGDGMVHQVCFRGGRASYRNRFVRTEGLLREQEAGRSLWAGLAERPGSAIADGGWGARGHMKDASSTDVVVHGGRALTSFYQCGDLYRLDPLTLDADGREEWGGQFPAARGVSAHARVDQAAGELLWFNYATTSPYLEYGVTDGSHRVVHHTPISLPGPRLPHDLVFTDRYVIFNDLPLFWDPALLARGVHVTRFHPDVPSRLGVMPRRGTDADVRWFEADPTYVLHWINAFEDGDEVVVDGFYEDCPEPHGASDAGPGGADARLWRYLALDALQARPHRWRLDLVTGAVREEHLSDRIMEFGVIHPHAAGRPYRFAYSCLGTPGWFLFDGIVRHDVVTGDEQVYRYGPGVYGSEVAVAPRPGGTGESDAYLVTLTTDMMRDCSECLVFDAAEVGAGPVARLRLPARIPSGTHACWAAPDAVPGWET